MDRQLSNQILEGRFIRRVLSDAGKDIETAQSKQMSNRGFESNNWYSGRSFVVQESTLDYTHLKKHRFVDMKTRNTKHGKIKKKSHPIHNKIVWGHYNNIVKELHFGFTNAVKEELKNIQD